jgi:LacI family transcriptional regulator
MDTYPLWRGIMVTLKEIAKISGFGYGTVARALAQVPYTVKQGTKEKIQKIAHELGYRKDLIAKTLVSGVSQDIGLIIPAFFDSPYYRDLYMKMISSVMGSLKGSESRLRIIFLRDRSEICDVLNEIRDHRLKGVILSPYCYDFVLSEKEIRAISVSVVVIGKRITGENITSIFLDDRAGGYDGTNYLLGLGHRKIAVIRGFREDIEKRYAGYLDAMREKGVKVDTGLVLKGDGLSPSAYKLVRSMLKKKKNPTAIYAFDDEMAYGAIKAVKDNGLSIPGDISVLGFDGLEIGIFMDPPLTTMERPVHEMARVGVEIINGENEHKGKEVVMKVSVRERGSCKEI